jgi:hypothetical protein
MGFGGRLHIFERHRRQVEMLEASTSPLASRTAGGTSQRIMNMELAFWLMPIILPHIGSENPFFHHGEPP